MKILIIRFSSIGDIVITSPVVRAVKSQINNAEIHFLTKEKFISLVENNPYIDRCIGLEDNLDDLILSLQQEGYDAVIDLHKNLRTRKIKKHLNTPWYSFNKLNIQKWLWVNFKLNLMPKKHLVDRYFEGITSLGVTNDHKGLEYFLPADHGQKLQDFNLSESQYIVISIGGTYATKRMPNSLLETTIKRLNKPCVLIGGGSDDEQNAERITRNVGGKNVVNLVNKLSIHDSAFLISKSAGVLTGDTGMMHIAAAYKKRIVSVWGNTHPLLGMYAYVPGEFQNQVYTHQVDLNCRPCSKLGSSSCPRGHFNCMNLQNVDEIVKNCT